MDFFSLGPAMFGNIFFGGFVADQQFDQHTVIQINLDEGSSSSSKDGLFPPPTELHQKSREIHLADGTHIKISGKYHPPQIAPTIEESSQENTEPHSFTLYETNHPLNWRPQF